jgi:hypothetical protein
MSFGRYGAWGGLALVALVVAGLLWSGAGSSAATARHPVLFGGSLVLEDSRPLTVIDVATAKVSVRLPGIDQQVAAATYGDVQAVPVAEGTMLVNRKTGTFNLLQQDNYVLDAAGPGVGLGRLAGATAAAGYASGPDVYIVRTAPSSTVSLVGEATVAQAERLEAAVQGRARAPSQITPLGFVSLEGEVSNAAGSAAVEGGNLWVLVPSGGRCLVQELKPGRQSLSVTTRTSFPVGCGRVALEAGTGVMGAASPGRIVVFKGPVSSDVALPASTPATSFLPVGGVRVTSYIWPGSRAGGRWSDWRPRVP